MNVLSFAISEHDLCSLTLNRKILSKRESKRETGSPSAKYCGDPYATNMVERRNSSLAPKEFLDSQKIVKRYQGIWLWIVRPVIVTVQETKDL